MLLSTICRSKEYLKAAVHIHFRLLVRAAPFLGIGTLVACTKPYDPPIVESGVPNLAVRSFPGVLDLARAGDTRVIWVHGMCTHDASWATERHATFAAALGTEPGRTIGGPGQRVAFETRVEGNKLNVDYLIWSPLTRPYKERLDYDKPVVQGGEFPHVRAPLNNTLKVGLVNDCLSDAVIYTGPNGNPVRGWLREALCSSFGGRYSDAVGCDVPDSVPTKRTVLISESLGSKILFDAIRAIWKKPSPAIARQLSSVQLVFMVSNQVPLLDTADQRPLRRFVASQGLAPVLSSGSSVGAAVDVLSEARLRARTFRKAPDDELQVVAFTDPNDLLSYRLTPASLNRADASIANIIVSNDPTYLATLERPDYAHCGYAWNPYVIGTIVHGYSGGVPASIPLNLRHRCGLVN
jgi:hypothetical protein